MRYFDHNATTPLCDAAKAAWLEASDHAWQNPSSPYRAAAAVRARLEACRERLGELLGVESSRIIFNSGATEGNNLVLHHWNETLGNDARIALSSIEHPSVLEPAKALFGGRIEWLPANSEGRVEIEDFDFDRVAAVSLMAANNETGVLQPWQDVGSICNSKKIPFHCDASQWVGKMPLSGLSECNFVTGCGHKFGGPKGAGFLVVSGSQSLEGRLRGGAQEDGGRAGTEDFSAIASLVAALEWAESLRVAVSDEHPDLFVAKLVKKIPAVQVVGEGAPRLWNTVMVEMPEFSSSRWIARLERRGFFVSAGSACSTGKSGPSHVLAAMGRDSSAMRRVLRISGGWETSREDWLAMADSLGEIYADLQSEASSSDAEVISI